MIDGYKQFFEICPQKTFLDFGLKNIITIDKEKSTVAWKDLVNRINNRSSDLYVRNSGRNGAGNEILGALYKDVFGININFDQTNNDKPASVIQELTGYRKNKTISNYQISHVFGNTKNVFCFTAPWNIVFIPKIIDPFTGHEAKGDFVDEFQRLFKRKVYNQFKDEIVEYNTHINRFRDQILSWIESNVLQKRKGSIEKDFRVISNY